MAYKNRLSDTISVKVKFHMELRINQTYMSRLHIINDRQLSPERKRALNDIMVRRLYSGDINTLH